MYSKFVRCVYVWARRHAAHEPNWHARIASTSHLPCICVCAGFWDSLCRPAPCAQPHACKPSPQVTDTTTPNVRTGKKACKCHSPHPMGLAPAPKRLSDRAPIRFPTAMPHQTDLRGPFRMRHHLRDGFKMATTVLCAPARRMRHPHSHPPLRATAGSGCQSASKTGGAIRRHLVRIWLGKW